MKIDLLHNQDNESPTSFAQRLGAQYMSTTSNEAKKEKGQEGKKCETVREEDRAEEGGEGKIGKKNLR